MPAIFNILPGIEVPVGEISKSFAAMWSDTAAGGKAAPEADDAKATQVNFVLHLGLNTTPADAVAQFATMSRFSQRYPSRIVVLCPVVDETGAEEMRAKIYGECHIGKSKADKRCVEFVLLSYPRAARANLENQVSICLSTDLPVYYWAHAFSSSGKLADYRFLLSRAKRVMLDSSIAPPGALTYPWPNPNTVRDLVYSRLLPVRQTIGQFLASCAPPILVKGLKTVTVSHGGNLASEARVVLAWLKRRLTACGAATEAVDFSVKSAPKDPATKLGVKFGYAARGKYFRWAGDVATRQALFESDFGHGATRLSAAVSLLAPEDALSEAMFF